jgi:hypothetical protein
LHLITQTDPVSESVVFKTPGFWVMSTAIGMFIVNEWVVIWPGWIKHASDHGWIFSTLSREVLTCKIIIYNLFVLLYDSLYHTSPDVCSKILLTAQQKFKLWKLRLSYFCFAAVQACLLSPTSINKVTNKKMQQLKLPTAEDRHSEKMSKCLLLSWW